MKLAGAALAAAALFLVAALLGVGSRPGAPPGNAVVITLAQGSAPITPTAPVTTGATVQPPAFVAVGRGVQSVSLAQLMAPPPPSTLAAGASLPTTGATNQAGTPPGQLLTLPAPGTASLPILGGGSGGTVFPSPSPVVTVPQPTTAAPPPLPPLVLPNLPTLLPLQIPTPGLTPTSTATPTPEPNLLEKLLDAL